MAGVGVEWVETGGRETCEGGSYKMSLGEIILTQVEVAVERTREGIASTSNKLESERATRAERRGKAGHTFS